MSVLLVCFTRSFRGSCNLYCFRTSGSQDEVGRRCDWITMGSFWFGGGLYQTNTKPGSDSVSNKEGFLLMEASPARTWLLKCVVYTLRFIVTHFLDTIQVPSTP